MGSAQGRRTCSHPAAFNTSDGLDRAHIPAHLFVVGCAQTGRNALQTSGLSTCITLITARQGTPPTPHTSIPSFTASVQCIRYVKPTLQSFLPERHRTVRSHCMLCTHYKSLPAEVGDGHGGSPAAGLLCVLLSLGLTLGLALGVLKLDCLSCSARLARSRASAILCTAPCAMESHAQHANLEARW